jgi:hypothetical protein
MLPPSSGFKCAGWRWLDYLADYKESGHSDPWRVWGNWAQSGPLGTLGRETAPFRARCVLYLSQEGNGIVRKTIIFRATVSFCFLNPSQGSKWLTFLHPVPCNRTDCSPYTLHPWRMRRNFAPKLRYPPIKTTVSQPRRPQSEHSPLLKSYEHIMFHLTLFLFLWFFAPCGCCWCFRRFGGTCLRLQSRLSRHHSPVIVPDGLD